MDHPGPPADEAERLQARWRALGLSGVVDVHTHFMPRNVLEKVWAYFDAAGPLVGHEWPIVYREPEDQRVTRLRSYGVERFTSLVYPHRPGMAAWLNDWATGFAARTPDCLHSATFYPEEDAESYVAAAVEAYGRIDVLHNNVGITSQGGPVETTEEVWDRVMAVNVKSMFLTCKAVLPGMQAQGSGAIVNIGALGGVRWTGYAYCAYAASKGAVNSLTQSVALQYASQGIRANCILPGVMDTPHIYRQISGFYASEQEMVEARHRLSPTGRMGDGWDVAHAAVFLASDEARYINGVELLVDGGMHVRCN